MSKAAGNEQEGKELHRVEVEFEPGRTPRLKLIHPKGGCEEGKTCGECGWSVGSDLDDRCEVCPDPDSGECWIEGWVDNYQADEVLAGPVEFAVVPECDGESLILHVAAEPPTVPTSSVEALVSALEALLAERRPLGPNPDKDRGSYLPDTPDVRLLLAEVAIHLADLKPGDPHA